MTSKHTGKLDIRNYRNINGGSFIGFDALVVEDIIEKVNELEARLATIENGNEKPKEKPMMKKYKPMIRVRDYDG